MNNISKFIQLTYMENNIVLSDEVTFLILQLIHDNTYIPILRSVVITSKTSIQDDMRNLTKPEK